MMTAGGEKNFKKKIKKKSPDKLGLLMMTMMTAEEVEEAEVCACVWVARLRVNLAASG